MFNLNQQNDEPESGDPVAHPHYPVRPLHAARPVYTIIEEEIEDVEDEE